MRFKPGELAYIIRPWKIDRDIGRPVTILRAGIPGEGGTSRDGGRTHCGIGEKPGFAWLVDANDDGFPCFVADECLRKLGGDEYADEMLQLLGKPEKETA